MRVGRHQLGSSILKSVPKLLIIYENLSFFFKMVLLNKIQSSQKQKVVLEVLPLSKSLDATLLCQMQLARHYP